MFEESSQQTAATVQEQQQVQTSENEDWPSDASVPVSTEPYQQDDEQVSRLKKIQKFKFEFGPSKKDILSFTNQLSVMIRAGISLLDALESIGEQCEKQKFKAIIYDLKNQIEAGQSFSQALAEHPNVFSNLYINMVGAAEVSGSLSEMLQKLAEYLDREAETSSQVKSACVYPVIIAVMAIAVTIFLLVFVLPRFTVVFAGKEHLLPLPTKALMATSAFLRTYWYFLIPAVGAGLWGFWYFVRTNVGKIWWDKMKLVVPLIKTLCRCLYITRCLHTMGVLSKAGVPILNTISITAQIAGNFFYKEMWLGVYDDVRQGRKIADSLQAHARGAGKRSGLMPGNVVQMIRSGEDSGTMSDVLRDVSEYYSRELKTIIKTVTSMIEPIMIVLMGILVGFIAMSIILPIFKMSSLVAAGK
ncbi:MAG: type II secretion system F family protein [Phycisphaerae bacterium]|nr:type II secretion system F family protein [Phycisphaerae bacterium]NIP50428.1 type II secretion system F family protein [Phycisphaerae bacterium]NIS49556.1 type II secretion system F family protein [Phycisphaerae bacterium]NIU07314.1 type II secretion system F family protein [Phycisphaerae bacterium]NIU54883.1 type II secretion system F family protein [Phycisphaerae bacterium]